MLEIGAAIKSQTFQTYKSNFLKERKTNE
jgi:hypothetical protein